MNWWLVSSIETENGPISQESRPDWIIPTTKIVSENTACHDVTPAVSLRRSTLALATINQSENYGKRN